MVEKVNMYGDPDRDEDETAYTRTGDVDSEELTERVRSVDGVDLDAYLNRHFDREEDGSGYLGTVKVDSNGMIVDVRVASQVSENPIV